MGDNEERKRKRKRKPFRKENRENGEEKKKIQAVIFVYHTQFSELAKRMRKKMENLEKLGKFKVKIVERTGNKVVDILHKSNAWSLMDCERKDCLICNTEKSKKGSCKSRNILYETFCLTCKMEGEEKNIDDVTENEVIATENEVMKAREEDDANDTPVFVEADSNKLVLIPKGNSSLENENSPSKTCPDIYKKGVCPPPTELLPVINIQTGENPRVAEVNMTEDEIVVESEEDDANDTPVFVEADSISNKEVVQIPNGNSSMGKRKREEESDKENKERKLERNYNVKYIGETNRSGYERGREHMAQFRNLDARSHLLKHYLKYHKNIGIENMEVGMRVKSTFKSAIERQISEAVAICRDERDGINLMNSKAEYNRCKLPRLNTQSIEDQLREAEEEKKKEKEIEKEIRELKKKKMVRKNREKDDLKELCEEIIEKEKNNWKRRRLETIREKEEEERIGERELGRKKG